MSDWWKPFFFPMSISRGLFFCLSRFVASFAARLQGFSAAAAAAALLWLSALLYSASLCFTLLHSASLCFTLLYSTLLLNLSNSRICHLSVLSVQAARQIVGEKKKNSTRGKNLHTNIHNHARGRGGGRATKSSPFIHPSIHLKHALRS